MDARSWKRCSIAAYGLGAAAGVGLLEYIMPDSPVWLSAFAAAVGSSLFGRLFMELWDRYGFDYGWWKAGREFEREDRKKG